MSSLTQDLDYAGFLQLPDKDALLSALRQARAMDFPALMEKYTVTLGPPTLQTTDYPTTAVQVDLLSTDVRQSEGEGALRYYRLDLGRYMACCQRYLTAADVASADTLAAWFLSAHKVYFDPLQLGLDALQADPDYPDRQLQVTTVQTGNYVWQGAATLWVVAPTHLGLFAKPGISTGIRWEDVGLSLTP